MYFAQVRKHDGLRRFQELPGFVDAVAAVLAECQMYMRNTNVCASAFNLLSVIR